METYVIHVTKRCQCQCLYCYEDDKSSTYSWEEISKLIDDLLAHSTGDFQIEFLGGEPLLEFDYIKKAVERLRDHARGFVITTNGTILNDEIVQFLKDNPMVRFAASLDGHRYANFMRVFKDGDRKNTHDVVIENIRRLVSEGIEVSVHIVAHPYNVAFLSDSINHLYKEGVRVIGVGIVEKTIPITQNFSERYVYEMDIVSKKIHAGEYPGLQVGEFVSLKPYSDVRTYIRDESGKVVGESYGRSGDDLTSTDLYDSQRCTEKTDLSEEIYRIRKTVYDNHRKEVRK